ncbi:MAG: hypothetical protein HYU37_03310 [Acidobacteria bacterium]|nr:hypothetical protein [Acidobacteriota bacterium]
MPDAEIYWAGQSGKEYVYWVHRIGTFFNNEPGNYVYAREVESGSWEAIYVGQTESLERRLDPEKEACARRHGATHVHVHTNRSGESRRAAEQADLVAKWAPVCNLGQAEAVGQAQEKGTERA